MIAEINTYEYLFLTEFHELGADGLRVVVTEGLPVEPPTSIVVGGTELTGCTPIRVMDRSRIYELLWSPYVGYSVLNESYASSSDDEQFEGTRFRLYSKSHFLDYMSRASFASDGYPGPTRHYSVACEDHIVNVLSVGAPASRRIQ